MALIDLWKSDRHQVTAKRVDQLIAFAGEGKLRDGNDTSREFRELLAAVPSDILGAWMDECLDRRFDDFGFVLQDIINEIGRRLDFIVTHGVYRGHANEGFDGLWQIVGGSALLLESKSSTAYSINLSRIAGYRSQLAEHCPLPAEAISILLVVGDERTEDLEAQVRGSRFAWDVRLLGMRALFRLLQLKETLDEPSVTRQIQDILVPQEFTRLDKIVDLVFATAEDVQTDNDLGGTQDNVAVEEATVATRSGFHEEILPKLETHFGKALVKRARVLWSSSDDELFLSCQVSKEYSRTDCQYWFGLKRSTKELLCQHENSYCVFGLGSPEQVVVIPYDVIGAILDELYTSPSEDGGILHWHIRFSRNNGRINLIVNREGLQRDVSEFVLD